MKRKSPDTSSEAAPIIKSPSLNTASSLQERSMAAILSTEYQVDASSLQKLTCDDLVQLVLALKGENKKLEEKNKKAEEKNKKTEEELASVRRNRYVVDPPFVGDRDGRYDLMEAVCSKWSVDVAEDGSDAGMLAAIHNSGLVELYSVKDRKHVLSLSSWCPLRQVLGHTVKQHIVDTGSRDNPDFKSVSETISSASLLYRLYCLFHELPVEIYGPRPYGYKFLWNAYVKHKASGKVFGFLDCKGEAVYQTPCGELEDEWVDDWIELLDILCSDHCPHPYDGLVAGSVA